MAGMCGVKHSLQELYNLLGLGRCGKQDKTGVVRLATTYVRANRIIKQGR